MMMIVNADNLDKPNNQMRLDWNAWVRTCNPCLSLEYRLAPSLGLCFSSQTYRLIICDGQFSLFASDRCLQVFLLAIDHSVYRFIVQFVNLKCLDPSFLYKESSVL